MLTKKAQLDVEEKKIKKKRLQRTPHCRQPAAKAHTQKPKAAGMRQCNRSVKPKKASVH
jgi:hypothetical protein